MSGGDARGTRRSLLRVAHIAWWEARRTGLSFNKKTLALLLLLGLGMALLTPMLTQGGLDFDRGLYRVAADDDATLTPVLDVAPAFRRIASHDPVGDVHAGRADVALVGDRIMAPDTDKGRAAIAQLKQAARDWTFITLSQEADLEAAFPVRVELIYSEQAQPRSGTGGIPNGGNTLPPMDGDGSGTTGGSATGGGGGGAVGGTSAPSSGFSLLPAERSINTPETLSPPFPFRSLILAYLFLIPLNFIVQVYAGSAIAERLGRKGEALLASPARPWEIITGKALPYFVLMMLVCALIAMKIGGGWLSVLAVAPLALTFLAFQFVAAMFARSFRELTFLTVFTSVLLTIYAFLPAVFTDVHPVALVSPITLVILDLKGVSVGLGDILYATLPLTFFSAVLFILGAALYREEDLFHQKRVVSKMLDSLAHQVKGIRSGFKLSVMLIPCVIIVELLFVAFLFAWPAPIGYFGVMLGIAFVEETFKALPSYAAVQRGIIPVKRALMFGAMVGLGFFVAEKGFLFASLVGLADVPAGAAVFGAMGAGHLTEGMAILLALGLLLAPLVLHVVTACMTAWGATHGRQVFLVSFALAVLVHTLYNVTVLRIFQAGGA